MLLIKTTLKETPGKGIGLFTLENIQQGSIIHIDETEFDKVYTLEFVKENHLKEFFDKYAAYNITDRNYYLCSDNARFMNHSFTPNTFYSKKDGQTIAKEDILVGEEITTDYTEFCDSCRVDGLDFKMI